MIDALLRRLRGAPAAVPLVRHPDSVDAPRHWPERVMIVANAAIPTVQLSFLGPLAGAGEGPSPALALVTEHDLKTAARGWRDSWDWYASQLAQHQPDLLVFCRYSGPHGARLLDWARAARVPTILHLDDDLLAVPAELGEAKFRYHNAPARLETVRTLLAGVTLVYCSTGPLRERVRGYGLGPAPVLAGGIYCASEVLRAPPAEGRTIGYMGFDHAHDFEIARPALTRFLDAHPDFGFELFGSVPLPPDWHRFGARVRTLEPVRDYAAFKAALAARNWTVGICPLARTPFNLLKADTKWVEYTACGIATVASAGTVYDRCCAGGAGVLVPDDDAAWYDAVAGLAGDAPRRLAQVAVAQDRLRERYAPAALRRQVLEVFDAARRAGREAATAPDGEAPG